MAEKTFRLSKLAVLSCVLALSMILLPEAADAAIPDGSASGESDASAAGLAEDGTGSGGELYRVQVAAYLSSRRAKKLKERIEGDGRFEGETVLIEYSAKSEVYRVKVGAFNDRAAAEEMLDRLQDAFPRWTREAQVVADHLPSSGLPREEDLADSGAATADHMAGAADAGQAGASSSWRRTMVDDKNVVGRAVTREGRSDYLIGPEDLLEISVFELEGLNKTVRVSEQGMITLPLVGDVRAEGLTQKELEGKIRDLLQEKYINDPQVSVFIREYRSRSVSVIGEVKNPGSYQLIGTRTVIHLLSEAGGLTEKAGPELYVIRIGPDGQPQRMTVNVSELMIEGRPESNLVVQAGDVINVPMDLMISVFIYGAVREPGELIFGRSEAVTLLQAITKAGGVTERAAEEKIRIKRRTPDGGEEQIKVNLKQIIKGKKSDIRLQDDDVVVIPETIF